MQDKTIWRNCSICSRPIYCGAAYYLCSVSTCNRKNATLHFCSPDCWDAHVPGKNHRTPECIEEQAPDRP